MKSISLKQLSAALVILIIVAVLPTFLPTYLRSLITSMFIFGIFSLSLNILLGYTGLFTLGHAAFFGMGAYATGILVSKADIHSFWLVALITIIATAALGAVFGLIALRVSGFKFLMVTFALGQLLFAVAYNWHSLTGGAFGLKGMKYLSLGFPLKWNVNSLYYFTLIIFVLCLLLIYRLVRSPFGHALKGIRENETRMRALGYNTWLYKYIAYIIAAAFAALAGVLFIHWHLHVSPQHLAVTTSTEGILYVIMGGAGTLVGPILGTGLVTALQYVISLYVPDRWPLILGVFFIIVVMFLRGGIVPSVVRAWKRRRG